MASPAVYAAASPAPTGALPTPWIEYTTPEGQPYYYNPTSQVTQWDRPVATPAPLPTPTPPMAAKSPVPHHMAAASPVGSIRGEAAPSPAYSTHSVHSVHSAAQHQQQMQQVQQAQSHSRAPSAATHASHASAASPHMMMQQGQQQMQSASPHTQVTAASPHQAYAKTPSPLPHGTSIRRCSFDSTC